MLFYSMGRVYLITNLINRKVYVGKTAQSLAARWRDHVKSARAGDTSCRVLYAAMRKYSAESFCVSQLGIAQTEAGLGALERYWICSLKCQAPNGYNIREGGQGGAHSEETREKMRATALRRPKECMDRIRALRTFGPLSEEHKDKLRLANLGKAGTFLGRKHSLETRRRMSLARRRREHTV
jgi:group I intron endonuclease